MPLDNEDYGEIEDLPMPDEAGTEAQAAVEKPADAASSSAEADASKPADADTLSIVRDVVDGKGSADAAASSASSEEAGEDTGDQKPTKTADDYSDVPFNKHPRFQEVLGKLKAAETDAVRYRNVQGFLDREGVSGEEAASALSYLANVRKRGLEMDELANGLDIMAQAKTDPAGAFERLRPWLQQLVVAAGEVLPNDLAQRVQNRELSPEAAFELSRTRARLASQDAVRSFEQQRAETDQRTQAQRAVTDAVAEWENDRRARDPNFDAKYPAIVAEAQKLQALGWKPTDPAGVKEQLKRAYASVNGGIRQSATPAPATPKPPVTPIRSGGHVAAPTAPVKPKSTLDIINQVVGARA